MEHDPSPEAHLEAFRQKIREFQQKFPGDNTLDGVKDVNEIEGTEVVIWEEFRSFVYRMKDLLENIINKTESPDSKNVQEMLNETRDFAKRVQTNMNEAKAKNQISKTDFYAWVLNRINPSIVNLQVVSFLSDEELQFILSEINQEIENTK